LAKTAREAEVTRDSLLTKLEKAFTVAEKAKNGSAMTMSVIGMARICGLIIDRREVGEVGAFSDYTDEQLLQEAMERARRLGLAGPGLVVANGPVARDGCATRNVRYGSTADMPKNAIEVAIGGKADMAYCSANVRL
jgi:hypothetical protein